MKPCSSEQAKFTNPALSTSTISTWQEEVIRESEKKSSSDCICFSPRTQMSPGPNGSLVKSSRFQPKPISSGTSVWSLLRISPLYEAQFNQQPYWSLLLPASIDCLNIAKWPPNIAGICWYGSHGGRKVPPRRRKPHGWHTGMGIHNTVLSA